MLMTRTLLLPATIGSLIENYVLEVFDGKQELQPEETPVTDLVNAMPMLNQAWLVAGEDAPTLAHPNSVEGGCFIQMAAFLAASWEPSYKNAEQVAKNAGYRLEVEAVWEMSQITASLVRRFTAANSNPVIDASLGGEMTARSLLIWLVPIALAEEADRRAAHIQSLNKQAKVMVVPQKEPV